MFSQAVLLIRVLLALSRMPIMDGHEATTAIRKFEKTLTGKPAPGHRVNGRIPIIAVSASLQESEKSSLAANFDGWILKPINFSRMLEVLAGITNEEQREQDAYERGQWERGGWLIGESLSRARSGRTWFTDD